MRLATFLELAREQILQEAADFARTIPALGELEERALRDHLPQVLEAISADLRSSQSRAESIEKAQGDAPEASYQTSAQTHGLMRAQDGIDVEQLVAEFRALRSSVLRLWAEAHPVGPEAIEDITRFNEAIDQAVAESVQLYARERERWREIFLGIVGHDLRGPLNAISLTVEAMRRQGIAPAHQTALLARGAGRIKGLLDSLLDYSRASLGAGMVLQRESVDLATVCEEELELLQAAFPHTHIGYESRGQADGAFDVLRVREAIGNLVSNAIKHGQDGVPVKVKLEGSSASVFIIVENAGELPPGDIERLFEPLREGKSHSGRGDRTHLGLGLFIVRQIARAHGGDIKGESFEGLVRFTVEIPKNEATA